MLWMWLLPDSNSWAVHMAYHTGMCASILNSNQSIEGHPELLGWGNVFQDPLEGELLLWVLGHRRCWFSGLGHHSGTSPEPSSQSLSTQYPLMYMTIRCASSEVRYYFFCFCGVEEKVVSAAPWCQFLYLVPVCRLIFPHDESNRWHVICEIHYWVAWVSGVQSGV